MRRLSTQMMVGILCVLALAANRAWADGPEARAHTELARKLADAGQTEMALARLDKAFDSDPAYQEAYRLAIPLWFRSGKHAAAAERLERLTLACPRCSFAWYALAGAYRKVGRFKAAALAYEMYLSQNPGDPDALYGLGMSLRATGDPGSDEILRRFLRAERRPERETLRRHVLSLVGEPGPRLSDELERLRLERGLALERGELVSASLLWALLRFWSLAPAPQ